MAPCCWWLYVLQTMSEVLIKCLDEVARGIPLPATFQRRSPTYDPDSER